ncbi:hypothetical protein RJG79_08635 [Mycoplasmatota bacterium WC44]
MQQCGDCLKVYDESEYTSCPFCQNGDKNSNEDSWTGPCADCDGSGRVECNVCEGEGEFNSEICTTCNGDGGMECPDCNGSGEATYYKGN